MKIITSLLLAAIFILALALGAQNQIVVNFNYLIAQDEFQLSTLLGITFGAGFGLGWLICGMLYFKAKFTARRLNKKVQKQQTELSKLRAEPVKE
ncbi:lipopolysaccharide assembly protein LapA domain-containing protein [Vibrio sp. Of7-15]|uniref:LapA family protein n=1 Tax=Vibrio sp. Of7-15 TaxID=2724879 RepID=UPI001EF3D06F|nr:lipopolysaccharide assembly protein LapA domain-containing protein [Vibrio sp. Of7-15]